MCGMYQSVDLKSLKLVVQNIDYGELKVPLKSSINVDSVYFNQVHNMFVRITLSSGVQYFTGLGEVVFEFSLSKSFQESSVAALDRFAQSFVGTQISSWIHLESLLMEHLAPFPNVMAAVEMSFWDATCRKLGVPLYYFMGGHKNKIATDVTIPLSSPEETYKLARKYSSRGFDLIKVIVGNDFDASVNRVKAIVDANPNGLIILDANEGFTSSSALEFLKEMKKIHAKICLFEQPVQRDDLEGFRKVTKDSEVLTAADESIGNYEEAVEALNSDLADVLNIKLSKFGVLRSTRLVEMANESKVSLMIGSSFDTRISSSFSAHFAAGIGSFRWVDLDSPLFLEHDPVIGGAELDGAYYLLNSCTSGTDLEIDEGESYTIAA